MYPRPGQTLGNYTVGEPIGRGAVGVVLAGTHRYLGHPVALKVLVGLHAFDPVAAARFFAEAKAARAIEHPNVVAVLDFGESERGDPYLVMERLEGRTLAEALRGGALGWREAARLAGGAAAGLAAAHARGTVHRDIKPANLFLTGGAGESRIKILDFGLARAVSSVGQTAPDAVMGTPRYMAPEQAEGAARAGPASDVYALGAVLYEMVTARPPFPGDEPGPLRRAHAREAPAPPRRFAPIDAELEALILRCLAKDAARRPGAAGLAAALGRISDAEAWSATPARAPRRRPRRALLVGALALGGLSLGALALQRRSTGPRDAHRRAAAAASAAASAPLTAAASVAPPTDLRATAPGPPAAAAPAAAPSTAPPAPPPPAPRPVRKQRAPLPPPADASRPAPPDPGPRIPPNDSLD